MSETNSAFCIHHSAFFLTTFFDMIISILHHMSLLLFLIFFAWFISAIIRKRFSYGKADYDFHEHPVQYVLVCIFILAMAALCMYRFLVEMEIL